MARTKTFRDTITPTGTAHMKRFENFKATVNHNVPALLQLIRPFLYSIVNGENENLWKRSLGIKSSECFTME
jgi:hypothetical protein